MLLQRRLAHAEQIALRLVRVRDEAGSHVVRRAGRFGHAPRHQPARAALRQRQCLAPLPQHAAHDLRQVHLRQRVDIRAEPFAQPRHGGVSGAAAPSAAPVSRRSTPVPCGRNASDSGAMLPAMSATRSARSASLRPAVRTVRDSMRPAGRSRARSSGMTCASSSARISDGTPGSRIGEAALVVVQRDARRGAALIGQQGRARRVLRLHAVDGGHRHAAARVASRAARRATPRPPPARGRTPPPARGASGRRAWGPARRCR
jgi:hypothetical protein